MFMHYEPEAYQDLGLVGFQYRPSVRGIRPTTQFMFTSQSWDYA